MKGLGAALIAVGLVLASGGLAVAADAAAGDPTQGDPMKGKQVFDQCMACHALDHAVVGPPLGGVIGRKAGSSADYPYSPLMKAAGDAGLVWSEAEIVAYLPNPTAFLTAYVKGKGKPAPGSSKMIFMLAPEKPRRNVAAYLATTAK